jgi:hypothetical protein
LNTLSLYSSFNENQVPHPYKTRGTIIVLWILIYIFWITKWKTKDSALNYSKYTAKSLKNCLVLKILYECPMMIQYKSKQVAI